MSYFIDGWSCQSHIFVTTVSDLPFFNFAYHWDFGRKSDFVLYEISPLNLTSWAAWRCWEEGIILFQNPSNIILILS